MDTDSCYMAITADKFKDNVCWDDINKPEMRKNYIEERKNWFSIENNHCTF